MPERELNREPNPDRIAAMRRDGGPPIGTVWPIR